jgi:hypothetical protein
MNTKDIIKWIKDESHKVALISCEWIGSAKEKVKKRLNKHKHYTYEEVLTLVDNETGMYAELADNWRHFGPSDISQFDKLSDGAVRPNREAYYKALIQQLPLCPIYPTNIVPFRKGNTRSQQAVKKYQCNDITQATFIKKIVNKFLKTQKAFQDCGVQPLLVNFYNDKTMQDMHKLKTFSSRGGWDFDPNAIKELAKELMRNKAYYEAQVDKHKVEAEQDLNEPEGKEEVLNGQADGEDELIPEEFRSEYCKWKADKKEQAVKDKKD